MAVERLGLGQRSDWHPDIGRIASLVASKAFRSDADDRARRAADAQLLAEGRRRLLELAHPEAVADDRCAGRRSRVVRVNQQAADLRLEPQDAEIAARDQAAGDIGWRHRPGERHRQEAGVRDRRHVVEDVLSPPQFLVDRVEQHEAVAANERSQDDEPIGLRHGERPKHYSVEHREDRCGRPDAQGE